MNWLAQNQKLVQFGFSLLIAVGVFYSIILHEISHALVSHWLGDDTAKRLGRLSLNPLKHIDWFGTVLLPLLLIVTRAGIIFGYAKPVPLNPYNYKNYKRDTGLSALGGPLTNILIAIVFALLYHMFPNAVILPEFCVVMAYMNLFLAFLNLIPIPPLDGSKILGMILPDEAYYRWTAQERNGMIFLFILIGASYFLRVNFIFDVVSLPVRFVMNLLGLPYAMLMG